MSAKSILAQRETLLVVAILLLVTVIKIRFPGFAAPANLANVFNDTAILIILALGQMAVILTRSINLSVAANLALTGMAVAMVNDASPETRLALAWLLSDGLGLALCGFNGLLIWKLDIPPIVVTLGTLTIYRGMAFVLSGGQWVNAHEMTPDFLNLPRHVFLGLPILSWVAIAIIGLAIAIFGQTTLGRSLYAVGGNPVAAVYAGIDVGRTRFYAFCLSGFLAGISGYLWVARYAVAYVDIAGGFELDVIAACVIGGISISGGIGSVGGAVVGALFLGIIKNALPVVDVSPFWQMAISGAIIIAAVTINVRSERVKGRPILRPAGAQP